MWVLEWRVPGYPVVTVRSGSRRWLCRVRSVLRLWCLDAGFYLYREKKGVI